MTSDNQDYQPAPVGRFRRLAAITYDLFLLAAVILVAVSLFTVLIDLVGGQGTSGRLLQQDWARLFFQVYLLIVAASFYLWFWHHGGQTLGLKAWKLKVVDQQLQSPGYVSALMRLLLAVITCLPLGLGLLWIFFDPQKQALYERLSGTRLVQLES